MDNAPQLQGPPPGYESLADTPPAPPEKVDDTAAEYRAAVDELLLAMLEEVDL